ncbi:FAST kinase domain-containing protein 2, mitochondrial [Nematolebias whitei]|uniref:FAST kinase domain-containing protein 2, mitochondrial n=1 Tax=Nematolebias whitei TaxID=451745 RepID=UPI001896DEB5|nr:FAST kinase domain-containing protein 2, mitochondrial [Nematolebias whitei]
MSVWMTDKVMRWSLRFYRGRFPWKQRSFLVTASFKDAVVFPIHRSQRFWGSTQNQTCLSRSLVGAVRFHSQGGNRTEELEENIHLPSQLVERSADVQQDGTDSDLRHATTPFTKHLQQCSSPVDILDLTCKYSLTGQEVSNSLNSMWTFLKKMTEEQRPYQLQLIYEHPELDGFLQKAMKSLQHMRNNDITYSLLSMISMGIPQHSRVVQTFLRACQERLNHFDEKSLSILASCLDHMEDSPNVDALKKGLRLAVVARLPAIKNVMALQILMRLLWKDAPNSIKQKLESKALSMTDQFSTPNAQHMISTMATLSFYSKPLFHVCIQNIKENLHNIPFTRLHDVLQSCKKLNYKDLSLFTGVSDYVSSTFDMWTNKQLLHFLSVFANLHFSPVALMEAFADKVIEKPDALTLKDLLCILRVYSSLNFDLKHRRRQFLDSVSCALDAYLPKMNGKTLLTAAYRFCQLNHFPPALLEQLLQTSVLEQIQEEKLYMDHERMLRTVDLCLRLDRPPLPRPLSVPTSVLERLTPICPAVNPLLSPTLQQLVAGRTSTELQEAVVVENFYVLDGVLTEAPSNQTCSSAEEPAEGAQRVAVIFAPNSNVCFGSSNPRGILATKLRHLKALGYTPVLVMEQDLKCNATEKMDVLRRLIFPEQTSEAT